MERLETTIIGTMLSFTSVFFGLIVLFNNVLAQTLGLKSFLIRLILGFSLFFFGIVLFNYTLYIKDYHKSKNKKNFI